MTRPSSTPDAVVRAMTDDSTFRVIAVQATDTVRGIWAAQQAQGQTASLLGDLVVAAILVRESMAPDLRVQLILQCADKRGQLIADAHPDGTSRGLVQGAASAGDLVLRDGDLLHVARTLHNGALQQGTVEIVPDGGVSQALMQYMQLSEQIFTVCAVGCRQVGGEVVAAGGYLVQLLPEVLDPSGPVLVMAERLRDFEAMGPWLEQGLGDPDALLGEILYSMPYTVVGRGALAFGCRCSAERVALALSTLPKEDLEALLAQDAPIELRCDYCSRTFAFQKSHLQGLLARN